MNRTTALKVLRNFGHLLPKISIYYGPSSDPNHTESKFLIDVEWYLAEYCSESTETISFFGIRPERTTPFITAGMQLPNIKTVHTAYCRFASNFSFNATFPNLRTLSLENYVSNFNMKDWHFPTVKHLRFNHYEKMIEINLIEMLKRHPQLEKFEMSTWPNTYLTNLVKYLNECLLKLHCLTLDIAIFRSDSLESFHLENITNFCLLLQTSPTSHHRIPFTFNKLEHFKFINALWPKTASTSVPDFVFQNKYLKTIDVSGLHSVNVIQLFELENVISNVEELRIDACDKVPSNAVEIFLSQSRSIKLLKISDIDGMSDTIKSKISGKEMGYNGKIIWVFGKTKGTKIIRTNACSFPSNFPF